MKYLTEIELEKLSTKKLLYHLRTVTATLTSMYSGLGPRCCEICNEYVGSDWEKDVGQFTRPIEKYKYLVKSILADREHLPRKKKKPTLRRRKIKSSSRGRGKYQHKEKKNVTEERFVHDEFGEPGYRLIRTKKWIAIAG